MIKSGFLISCSRMYEDHAMQPFPRVPARLPRHDQSKQTMPAKLMMISSPCAGKVAHMLWCRWHHDSSATPALVKMRFFSSCR